MTIRIPGIDLGKGERGEQRRAALEEMAQERGLTWNNKPSIGRLIVALADEQIASGETMKTQWNVDGSAVKIYGQHSPHPIIATNDVVKHFEDVETTFHQLHRLRKAGMLARPEAGEGRPFSMADVKLAEENEQRGHRHWRFGTLYPTVHEYIRGYHYIENGFAVFRDGTHVKIS